jgi:predicted lipoprotein
MTTHRWGIAAVLAAVVLSGCHKALTPAAKQGYASAATPRERVATDRVAENLAYRAYYNSDAAALATLEVRAKTDPAFRWGLYKFYTLEASHFGPDMGTPLLTKAIRGISTPRVAEHEHKREALIARAETDQQKDQTRLQKTSLLLLEQAAAKNDPAAENALAGEYWSEPNTLFCAHAERAIYYLCAV